MTAQQYSRFEFKLTTSGLSGNTVVHLASAANVPVGEVFADKLFRRMAGVRMYVQFAGLACGAGYVFQVGTTNSVGMLLAAMTGFGLCKGLYDSNIFASLYDVVPPRVRATAAGLIKTVGWGVGALGLLYVGWATKYDQHGNKTGNMSHAIVWGGAAYVFGAIVPADAAFGFAPCDVRRTT